MPLEKDEVIYGLSGKGSTALIDLSPLHNMQEIDFGGRMTSFRFGGWRGWKVER